MALNGTFEKIEKTHTGTRNWYAITIDGKTTKKILDQAELALYKNAGLIEVP